MARRLQPSMLDSARRAGARQVATRVQRLSSRNGGTTVVGILRAYEEEPTPRAEVDVLGSTLWLGATPGGYVRGGGVHVLVDGSNRPTWVSGPTGTPVPDSLEPTTVAQGAEPLVIQPDLSIDPAARAENERIGGELGEARTDLDAARQALTNIGADEGADGVWHHVVEEGFLATTTPIVTPAALVDGAVTARTLNVVHELPNGAAVSIQPDGLRLWREGNDPATGQPNVTVTTGDGFRVQDDTGQGLLWIDPATGDLNTAGTIMAGGEIIGTRFVGGEIDLRDAAGGPILTASTAGVQVGGEGVIWQQATPINVGPSGDTGFVTLGDPIMVSPGRTYRTQMIINKIDGGTGVEYRVAGQWYNASNVVIAVDNEVVQLHALQNGAVQYDAELTAPAGAVGLRLRWHRVGGTVPPYEEVSFTGVRVATVGSGDISVSGDVKGTVGHFGAAVVQGDLTVLGRIRSSRQVSIGGTAGWPASAGAAVFTHAENIYLIGSVSLAAASTNIDGAFRTIGQLPAPFRPALTSAQYAVVMNSAGQVFEGSVNAEGAIRVRSPGGNQVWETGVSVPLSMFGPLPMGG